MLLALASAQDVLKILAHMVIVLRDEVVILGEQLCQTQQMDHLYKQRYSVNR